MGPMAQPQEEEAASFDFWVKTVKTITWKKTTGFIFFEKKYWKRNPIKVSMYEKLA